MMSAVRSAAPIETGPIVHRKCACGGTKSAFGGECEACRRKDAGVQTSRYAGEHPSGEMTNKVNARVTVKAIDTKTPAVTVAKSNGEIVDLKVEDGERLKKFKVGDEVDITYTESLMLTVEPKKP